MKIIIFPIPWWKIKEATPLADLRSLGASSKARLYIGVRVANDLLINHNRADLCGTADPLNSMLSITKINQILAATNLPQLVVDTRSQISDGCYADPRLALLVDRDKITFVIL